MLCVSFKIRNKVNPEIYQAEVRKQLCIILNFGCYREEKLRFLPHMNEKYSLIYPPTKQENIGWIFFLLGNKSSKTHTQRKTNRHTYPITEDRPSIGLS